MADHKPPSKEFDAQGVGTVLLSFSANFLWGGVFKSLGVLLPVLEVQFTSHTWVIGIIIAAISVSADITGMFTNFLEKKVRTRKLLILSALLEVVGLLLVPFAPNLIVMSCALVLLVGTGCGILNVLNKVLIARHFVNHFALACGIGHSGQVLAFAFAPVVQLFTSTYGWRGATLLIAAIFAHIVASAAAVRENKSQYQCVPHQDLDQDKEDRQHTRSVSAAHLCTRIYEAIDLGMMLQFKFWIICSVRFAQVFAYNAWMIYYVPHLLAKGFSAQTAANLCLAVVGGFFIGTVIWAPLIDRGMVRCSTGIITAILILTLSFCIDPIVNNAPGIAAVTFVFGLGIGSTFTLIDAFIREVFEIERLTSAYGLSQAFAFVPRVLGGFLPGWLYEKTGSYDTAFIVMGLSFSLTLVPLIIGIVRKKTNTQPDV